MIEVVEGLTEERTMGSISAFERGECEYWYENTFIKDCEKEKARRHMCGKNMPLDVNKNTKEVRIDYAILNLCFPLNPNQKSI